MILWTIQHAMAWDQLERQGFLRGDGRRAYAHHRSAYRWMAERMRLRLPAPHAKFPLWGWYRWQGASRARPDLRASGHLPKDTPGVRIEFETPETSVLLSDFDAWHCILNCWFLSLSEEEDNAFVEDLEKAGIEPAWPYPEPFHSRVVSSWERIFDLGSGDPEWRGPSSERPVQATFWELALSQVRRIEKFIAR